MKNSKICIRKYPWQRNNQLNLSEDTSELDCSYGGNTLIEVPSKYQLKLKKLKDLIQVSKGVNSNSEEYTLYSLPQPAKDENSIDIQIIGEKNSEHYLLTYKNIKDNKALSFETISDFIKHWINFFEELIAKGEQESPNKIAYDKLEFYLKEITGNEEEPYYAMIVKICNELGKSLPSIIAGIRKILKAQNELMPINRISEMDAACIRWIVKQPGESIYEKASANNFRLMGVNRNENYDLLENRVLKDFLIRCKKECRSYLNNLANDLHFSSTERYRTVKHFLKLCQNNLETPIFEKIARQRTLPMPNYVLQNDIRYKKIWKFYLQLVRKERLIDYIWGWQHRLFTDIAKTIIQTSLCSLVDDKNEVKTEILGNALVKLSPEQVAGSKLLASSIPGPFYSIHNNKHYVIECYSDIFSNKITDLLLKKNPLVELGELGTGNFITIENIETHNFLIFPIYCLHTAITNIDSSYQDIAKDAYSSINCFPKGDNLRIIPIIICSDTSSDEVDPVEYKDSFLFVLNVFSKSWQKNIFQIKQFFLAQIKNF